MIQNDSLPAEEFLDEKIDVMLVVLKRDALDDAIKNLNLDRANLVAIVADGYGKKNFTAGKNKIPVTTFTTIHTTMRKYKKIFWLISGSAGTDSLHKTKKFLMTGGVSRDNIINFETPAKISATWQANLRHIDEHGADFFVTGNEYTQVGVNLNLIPHVHADAMVRRGGCSCRRRSNFAAKLSDCPARLRARRARHD